MGTAELDISNNRRSFAIEVGGLKLTIVDDPQTMSNYLQSVVCKVDPESDVTLILNQYS